MRTVWDERKRQRNLREHGLDFAEVDAYLNLAEAVVMPTYPGQDSRARYKAIGILHQKLVVLVFSALGTEAISLISLRPASRAERRFYDES